MKIGIIVGSIRESALGPKVGAWVAESAKGRDHEYSLVEVASFDLPLLTNPVPPMALNREYGDTRIQAWSAEIDSYDAYIFVTPEYNHSVPGAFKNAIDLLGPELIYKPVGFVGYGANGGIRAVEHWRTILANFHMIDVRSQVDLNIFADFKDGELVSSDRHEENLKSVFSDVEKALS